MRDTEGVLKAQRNPRLTFDVVEAVIRKRNYGVLGTMSTDGRPHSAGVLYSVSAKDRPFAFYIVTDRRSKKVRNILRNPNVSFAIPIPRRLGILPPSSIQFQGKAEPLALTDEKSREAFNSSIVLRRVLKAQLSQKAEVSTFIRVWPDQALFTYGVGMSILKLMRHIEGAASRVEVPPSRREEGNFAARLAGGSALGPQR